MYRFIAAGFGNGMIGLWDLQTKSVLLRNGRVLHPVWSFYGHSSTVTGSQDALHSQLAIVWTHCFLGQLFLCRRTTPTPVSWRPVRRTAHWNCGTVSTPACLSLAPRERASRASNGVSTGPECSSPSKTSTRNNIFFKAIVASISSMHSSNYNVLCRHLGNRRMSSAFFFLSMDLRWKNYTFFSTQVVPIVNDALRFRLH